MAESTLKERIAASSFFADLPPEYVDVLAAHAKTRHVERDRVLFRTGEHAQGFFLITAGHIVVEVAAIEGPSLPLQDLGPDSVLGWSWLIPPTRWAFQARAEAPTDVIEFDGQAVLQACESDPRLGYQLMKRFASLMSERLQNARQRMMEEWRPVGFA
jgi:CRP/FNR family cyclic AMP-dependent transcriptional regulator